MGQDEISSTERALYGDVDLATLHSTVDGYTRSRLGSGLAEVVFRSGRIDAVWGVVLDDGRRVVIKAHRPPVDLANRMAGVRAQHALVGAGFPCPVPISGPDRFGELVLSAETLTDDGEPADGRDPLTRRAIAAGLARHIELLRPHPELMASVGKGPAWNRYEDGPWPVPHDPIFDFSDTPAGYGWLDEVAAEASRQILTHRGEEVVIAHGDWYGGNLLVADGAVSATFDWDLMADTEAVVAGMAAACYAASSTAGGGLSDPAEVTAFLADYDDLRPLSPPERRAAAGAATWILAFNARCELGLLDGEPAPGSPIALLRDHRRDYLDVP